MKTIIIRLSYKTIEAAKIFLSWFKSNLIKSQWYFDYIAKKLNYKENIKFIQNNEIHSLNKTLGHSWNDNK